MQANLLVVKYNLFRHEKINYTHKLGAKKRQPLLQECVANLRVR